MRKNEWSDLDWFSLYANFFFRKCLCASMRTKKRIEGRNRITVKVNAHGRIWLLGTKKPVEHKGHVFARRINSLTQRGFNRGLYSRKPIKRLPKNHSSADRLSEFTDMR